MLDSNGDGKIEYEELKLGLKRLNLHPRKMMLDQRPYDRWAA